MATNTKTKTEAVTTPTTWEGTEAEVLDGVDLVDKSTLEGVPFLITGICNHIGAEERLYAQIEFTLSADPEDLEARQMFQDSGKGIRDQVDSVFLMRDKAGLLEEWIDVRIKCPKGLRPSEYETTDERGRPVKGITHYLTTSGRRRRNR